MANYDDIAGTAIEDAVAYFLDLRLRTRGNEEARAIVDRCLALIARALAADRQELVRLEREIDALADELALRFGSPQAAQRH